MSVRLVLAGGGEATLVALSGEVVRVTSGVAAPPGARIDATLESDASVRLRFKVHAARRGEDGTYTLEGRPLDLTREMRERLARWLGTQGGMGTPD